MIGDEDDEDDEDKDEDEDDNVNDNKIKSDKVFTVSMITLLEKPQ